MKMKKLIAVILALCLFMADALPVVTAVAGSAEVSAPTQVVYDFNLRDYSDNLNSGNFSLEDGDNIDYL